MGSIESEKNYTVIIGDIVDSRKLEGRGKIQKRFKEVLENINVKYSEKIRSKFRITLGDEFQGLLMGTENVMQIVNDIEYEMFPVRFRFGIGIGEIDTEINYENSAEIDGPAYHRARNMIRTVEQRESQYGESGQNILICSGEESENPDRVMNALLAASQALRSKWTQRQCEIVKSYERNEENQYKTAEALGISQSSVSRALDNARFYAYKTALDTISDTMAHRENEKC